MATGLGGEIITLSFGPQSNWTSRCFWELQERHEQLVSLGPASLAEEGGESGRVGGGDGGARDKGGCGADVGLVGATVGGQLGVAGAARQAEIARQYAAYGVRRSVHYGGGRSGAQVWPRALFFDLKDSPISHLHGGKSKSSLDPQLGAPQGNGVLGATMAARSVWGGNMIVHRRPPPRMSPSRSSLPMASASEPDLARLAEQQAAERRPAKDWSDRWNPRRLHARSLLELREFRSGVARFDVFTHGYEVLASKGGEEAEEIFESFRCQLEDCDRVQGFQVLVDCDSGFGGLCADFLQDFVREECRTAPTLVFGLMDSLTVSPIDGCADGLYRDNGSGESTLNSQRIASRSINQSLALHTLGDLASVFVPVHAHSLHTAADATLFRSDVLSDRDMRLGRRNIFRISSSMIFSTSASSSLV